MITDLTPIVRKESLDHWSSDPNAQEIETYESGGRGGRGGLAIVSAQKNNILNRTQPANIWDIFLPGK